MEARGADIKVQDNRNNSYGILEKGDQQKSRHDIRTATDDFIAGDVKCGVGDL